MDDVAIYFQKIDLGNGRWVFKPITIIRGSFDAESEKFVTDCGFVCDLISGMELDSKDYFFCPTTIKGLRKKYGEENSEEVLLTEYLNEYMSFCYIGYYDDNSERILILKIPFDDLEDEQKGMDTGEDSKSGLNKKASNICDVPIQETKKDKNLKLDKAGSKEFNLKELRDVVLKKIISQDEAVNKVTARIGVNYTCSNSRMKSHILIAGPTATGKTEMINIICQHLNIPHYKVTATDYTQEGYVGKSVDYMIKGLIDSCNGDIEAAQNGILVIDEIDKKASNILTSTISNKAVLDSLLKITGRNKIQVEISNDSIEFDTSNLTVILMGAFDGIFENKNKNVIGFGNQNSSNNQRELDSRDFVKYGMTPELMRRIKCIAVTHPFEVEDYVKLLYKSEISPLAIAKEYYEKDHEIKFTFTSSYVKEIAKKARELNEGAGGIDKLVSMSLENVTEKILNGEKVKSLKLTKQTALNNKNYYME